MEKIKGFSIELNLDSIKVDAGLKDLRSSMRLMNSEMRKNMSQFDYGERSLKKYGAQLDGLNKKLELQKTVTESARKHYEKMVSEHGEGSRKAQEAAASYNHESAQLNNLERHIQKVTNEMRSFKREQEIQSTTLWKTGSALESFEKKLDGISSKARSMGNSLTKYVTTPIAGLTTAVGGMGFKRAMDIEQVEMMMEHISDNAKEYEQRMKNVVDLVTDTRFGTAEVGAEYAKFIGASASDVGAKLYSEVAMNLASFKSDDQLIPQIGDLFTKALQSGKIDGEMINQFTNAGVDILKVLGNKWGMQTDKVRKRLQDGSIDIHEVLNELSQGILEGTEGELGITKAMGGMLEKSGRTLSGQLKNFFAAISQTGERLIKDTGLFDGVKNSLDELRNMLKSGELDSVLLPTFRGISEAIEALVETSRKIFKWFSSLDDSTKEWIGKLVGLSVVIGPIVTAFGIFGGILGKVSGGIGNILKLLAPLSKNAGKSFGVLSKVFKLFTGPVGITIGVIGLLTAGFVTLYKRSEKFRESLDPVIEKLKDFGGYIKDGFFDALEAVKDFFGEIKERFTTFKDSDGSQLIKAFENVGLIVSNVFDGILSVIQFVMPAIEFIIKTIWGNIKGIITGVLDVIYGAVKVFGGLLTLDFSKMWEGIKEIFFGAIKIVWNWIQLQFIGRILKGVGGLARGFWGHIKNMWKWVKDVFKNSISRISTSIRESFVGRMLASVRNLKTKFVNIAKDMWTGVKEQFNKIVEGAKGLPGRIGKGIKNARSKAVDGMKSVGNSIIRWAGKPFNKVVDGVNWITGKLGVDRKIPKWDYPQYAKGTKRAGHPGGWAMIGEKGRELVKLPDGKTFISPNSHTMIDLPRGTHVIPNKPTEKLLKSDLPHYAKGTGFWEGVKNAGKKVKKTISDVWDYASNPSKLVKLVMDKIDVIKDKAQIPTKIVKAGFNYLKTKPIEYIKKMFKESGGNGKPAFGWPITSRFGYRIHPLTGQRKLHGGVDFGAPSGSPVPSTTGGTVSFASSGWNGGFGNLVKVRQGIWEMFYAHLSKILVRAGQSVKKGDILGLIGSTGASTGPHLHYETRKSGVRVNPMSLKGFSTGGLVKSKMLAWLGEEGEEVVIPLAKNRRSDAMKLLALAAKKIGGGQSVGPSQLPNVTTDNGLKDLLNAVLEQNEILLALLNKDWSIEADGRNIAEVVGPYIETIMNKGRKKRSRELGEHY